MNQGTKGAFKVAALGIGSEILRTAIVTLTSAQILALFGTPVTVLAAPLAGIALVVDSILFGMTTTATAYANGGVVTFQYLAGAVVHASSIPASVINAGAGTTYTLLAPNTQANGVTVPAATSVTVSNATAAFITGTGTAKIWIRYRMVNL